MSAAPHTMSRIPRHGRRPRNLLRLAAIEAIVAAPDKAVVAAISTIAGNRIRIHRPVDSQADQGYLERACRLSGTATVPFTTG